MDENQGTARPEVEEVRKAWLRLPREGPLSE